MKTLEGIADGLIGSGIYFPLPWNGYNGAFCCFGCQTSAIMQHPDRMQHEGFVMINEQLLDDYETGDEAELWIMHSPNADENGDALGDEARATFAAELVELLQVIGVPVSWDGIVHHRMKITARIGVNGGDWIKENMFEDDEDEDEGNWY